MAKGKIAKLIKVAVALGIVAIGVVSMTLLGSADKKSNKKDSTPEARLVNTTSIKFENMFLNIEGNGVIESQRNLNIISEVSGVVIYAKNDLKPGTFVKEGEEILKIDTRQSKNNLFSMRSDFMNSIASVLPDFKIEDKEIYEKWYSYFIGLKIDENIPELPKLSNSQEKVKLSSRNIYNKYFDVRNQEILLSKHIITAPYSGFITNSDGIIEGSYIPQGKDLFSINDVKNLEIAVPLLVEEVNKINLSSNPIVEIKTEKSDVVFKGKVVRSETNLNKNSQTINVFVLFDNHKLNPYFLPGNYVKVSIKGNELKNVAKIPRYVLDNENNIYTLQDSILGREKVEVIAFQGEDAIIKNTISVNTEIVTTILQKPLVGMKIKKKEELAENGDGLKSESVNQSKLISKN